MAGNATVPQTSAILRNFSAEQVAPLSPLLRALWHDIHGDWQSAHEIAQEIQGPDASWVHAYLHRREGDLGNAAYWYRQARKPVATASLEAEWNDIAKALLAGENTR